MLKKHFNSKTFLKTFALFCIVLIIPIIIFFSSFYITMQRENKKKVINSFENKAANATTLIDSKFIDIFNFINRMVDLPWITKFMSETSIFNGDFTEFDKLSYCNDLGKYDYTKGFISNISIVFPGKNTVVNSESWYTKEDYFNRMKISKDINLDGIFFKIESPYNLNNQETRFYNVDERFIIFSINLELSNQPRAYAVVLIDKLLLKDEISIITDLDQTEVNILNNQGIILNMYNSSGNQHAKQHHISSKSVLSSWSLNYTYEYNNFQVLFNQILIILSSTFLSIMIGIIVAFFLARISYKPLKHLLEKTGYSSSTAKNYEMEYQYLEQSFETILLENTLAKKDAEVYLTTLRNNILLQLLKGYFQQNTNDNLSTYGIDFNKSDYYFVMIVKNTLVPLDLVNNSSKKAQYLYEINSIIDNFLQLLDLHYYIVENINNEFIIMIALPECNDYPSFLSQTVNELATEFEDMTGDKLPFTFGTAEQGYIGISKSYQMATEKKKIFYDLKYDDVSELLQDSYYFPTEWEIQLINNMKQGKADIVSNILSEIFIENEKRNVSDVIRKKLETLLVETMMRVLIELDLDVKKYLQNSDNINDRQYEFSWERIITLGENICRSIQNEKDSTAISSKLADYIKKDYANFDLSLKELSKKFGLSVCVISKMFKEQNGINFYTYLSHIRMEKAKDLLKSGLYDTASIANMVGYENEYSFRRAFLRYEGIKPKEFKSYSLVENKL